jgi:hypothetical protein
VSQRGPFDYALPPMTTRTTRLIEIVLVLLILAVGAALVVHLIRAREPVYQVISSDQPSAEGLRVTIPARPHSIRDYLQDPSSVGRTVTFEVSTNSRGFRGPEVVIPKPRGRQRVVVVGECVAFGSGVADRETYPHLLGELLAARHPELDLEVINASLATEPPEFILRLLREQVPAFEPDVVVYAPGADTSFLPCHTMGPPFRLWLEDAEYQELLASFRAQLEEALAQSQEQGFELVLLTPTFSSFFFPDGQHWVDDMNAFGAEHGLPVLDSTALVLQAEATDGLVFSEADGVQRITRYQGGQGTVLIEAPSPGAGRHIARELLAWFDANPEQEQLLSIDGNHPNVAGHRLLAEELAGLLERKGLLGP